MRRTAHTMPNPARHTLLKTLIVCGLVAVAAVKIFWNLGVPPLQRWDEQGNVHVVQTTLRSGQWLTLMCKDKCSDCKPRETAVPFLDKPPLWYWLTMASVRLFGENNVSFRLVSALAGFILALFIFRLGSLWFGFPAGVAAALTLLTARHLFMTGGTFTTHSLRTADVDSLHLLFIMLGIYFYQRALRPARPDGTAATDTAQLALAMLASCLAYFTKGPMGFLPVAISMLYLAVQAASRIGREILTGARFARCAPAVLKDTGREAAKTLAVLALAAAVVLVPWYACQYAQSGQAFIDEHILYHLVRRAREPLEGHHGGWRFYVHIFFNLKIFLMGVPACIGLMAVVSGAYSRPAGADRQWWWNDFRLFSVVSGFLISFAVITAVQTKLIWYIFYVYPFAALLTGLFAAKLWQHFRARSSSSRAHNCARTNIG